MLVGLLSVLGSELTIFKHVNIIDLRKLLLQSDVDPLLHGFSRTLPLRQDVTEGTLAVVKALLQILQTGLEQVILLHLKLRRASCGTIAA